MSSRLQDIAMKRKINGLIKLLSEAADTAAGTIEPTLDNFNDQISTAQNDTKIKVPGKDVIFSKSRGNWYVSGAGIASDKLTSILSDAGKKKLNAADKKKDQDLALKPTDFIANVKAVNFTRGSDGSWSDRTPVEPSIIKKYLFGTVGGDIDVSADSSSGNYFVHQDMDLSYVFTGASFSIMVTDKDGNPLMDMSRLLDRTGLGERYKTQDKDKVSPEIIKVIDDAIELPLMFDNLPDAGTELKDAIGDIRTVFGKFADLFSRDDLKVNFSFKDYGPTFERRLVTGRAGGLAAKDIARMRATGYFKNQALPAMSPGNYKFTDKISGKEGKVVSVATSGVSGINDVTVDNLTLSNTYGSALYLYLKGYLVYEGERRQSIEAPPAEPGQSQPSEKTPEDQWKEYVENLLDEGDWNWTMKGGDGRPGGIFFQFNQNKTDKTIPGNYVEESKKNIDEVRKAYDEIFKNVNDDKRPAFGIGVVVIATGDTIGTPAQNDTVSSRRAVEVSRQLSTRSLGAINMKPLGEKPWTGSSEMQAKDKLTTQNKADLRYARFGTSIFVRTSKTDINYESIARKFFLSVTGAQEQMGVQVESYRANLINEIRRIIKETK